MNGPTITKCKEMIYLKRPSVSCVKKTDDLWQAKDTVGKTEILGSESRVIEEEKLRSAVRYQGLSQSGSGLPSWIDPFNADISQCPSSNFAPCAFQAVNWPQFIGWVIALGIAYKLFSRVIR
jgi:hypothetical protein